MKKLRLAALVLFCSPVAIFAPVQGQAQIFDALQYIDAIENEGWYANVGLGGRYQTGNTNTLSVGGSAMAGWRWEKIVLFATAKGEFAQASGSTYKRNIMEHLRYRYLLSDLWSYEIFLQHEYDSFRRIAIRGLGGLGPRFTLPTRDRVHLSLGVAYMAEYLEIAEDSTTTDGGTSEWAHRISSYLNLDIDLIDRLTWATIAYYQPRVTQFTDFRSSVRSGLDIEITKWWSVELFFALAYDSTPAEEVESLDIDSGLKMKFAFQSRPKDSN